MASSDQTATRAGGRHGRPWRAAGAAVVVLLAMVGAGMIGASLRTEPPPRPPQPRAQSAPQTPAAEPDVVAGEGPVEAVEVPPAALSRSAPGTISIPRIGVDAEIMTLGTNPDGTVQVPRWTRPSAPAGTPRGPAPARSATR